MSVRVRFQRLGSTSSGHLDVDGHGGSGDAARISERNDGSRLFHCRIVRASLAIADLCVGPEPPDTLAPEWLCVAVFSVVGVVFAFGGIGGYTHFAKPGLLSRWFAPVLRVSRPAPQHKPPPTDGAAT